LGLIKFDKNKIEQIIMNMIVNAKDAMPNGGKLFIETRNVFLDEEYCSRHPEAKPGDYVLLSLTDTGHGMSEDVLQHIFEPFFTTKEKGSGTGLGLATVYGIVKQAEGHISVHSQEGQGTTFFIYFPKSTEINQEPVSEEIPQIFLNDLKGEETILVVEDDHTVRQVVVETLANYGYHILEATNGSEALEIYSLNSHKIDLVISDVVMPQMDGREFRKKILQTNPNCKFIFMSGYTDTTIMNFDELQSVEYLQKPFKLTELLRKVRSMFSKKSELTF
jgi:CheY-like chemotaxis protein